jgi:hypothetical protein
MSYKDDINRREVLKSVSVSVGAITGASSVVGASNIETIEIPALISDGQIVKTKEVPSSWYNHYRNAKDQSSQLEHQLREAIPAENSESDQLPEGVKGVAISRDEATFDGVHGFIIEVHLKESSENQANQLSAADIPSHSGNIPVETIISPVGTKDACNTRCTEARQTEDPVPGGTRLQALGPNSENSGGFTSCCKVYYNNNPRLLTCAHAVDWNNEECNHNSSTADIYQPDITEQYVGNVSEVNGYDDWSLIKEDSNSDLSNGFTSDIAVTNDVMKGVVSQSNIGYLISNSAEVNKVGRTTCHDTATLTKEWQNYGGHCNNDGWVQSDAITKGGDSGGPVYFKPNAYNDDSYLAYMHVMGVSCEDGDSDSKGVSGYKLENQYGLSIT